MITSIYNKVYPYIPFNATSFVTGVACGLGSYILKENVPLAVLAGVIAVGLCDEFQKWLAPLKKEEKSHQVEEVPPAPVPAVEEKIPPAAAVEEEIQVQKAQALQPIPVIAPPSFLKRKGIDQSTLLSKPVGQFAGISNRGNSCFCSSILWSFFLNEPACLTELPKAIVQRMDEEILFGKNISTLDLTDAQIEPISNIGTVLSKQGPVTKQDLDDLRGALQELELIGFPKEISPTKLKELLSLLELYDLIHHFQSLQGKSTEKEQIVDGNRVNTMRKMVARVNNTFKDTGTQLGDANEVFNVLADLIFYDEKNPGQNWGSFFLSVGKNKRISEMLTSQESPNGQFSVPPSFLALTANRALGDNFGQFDPIILDEEFTLPKAYFKNGQAASYELVGATRRRSDMAHYDAIWKQGDQWYYGDDAGDEKVFPFNTSQVQEVAAISYIFFYRKK